MATRPKREAATKANEKIKNNLNERESIIQIYRGNIRYAQFAYVNPTAKPSVGNDERGEVLIASLPLLDAKKEDYGADTIFANELNKSHFVKALNLVNDIKQYKKHLKKVKRDKDPLIPSDIRKGVKFVLKNRKINECESEDEKQRKNEPTENIQKNNNDVVEPAQNNRPSGDTKPPTMQRNQSFELRILQTECDQFFYWLGYNYIWQSVSDRSLINNKKCHYDGFMSGNIWTKILKDKFDNMAMRVVHEKDKQGNIDYNYDKINNFDFYDLMGEEYCIRKIDNKFYYMDNITVRYKAAQMNFFIDWFVANKGKKPTNRCRIQPAQNF